MSLKQDSKHQDILGFLNEELLDLKEDNNNDFNKNLSSFSNEKLCEIVAAYRYLGIMKNEAISSMEELAKRRLNGDQFNFEDKIIELQKDLPQINIDLSKFSGMNFNDIIRKIGL